MNCCICYEQITLKNTALLVDCHNQLVCECSNRMCNKCVYKLSRKKCPTCRTRFEYFVCLGVGCQISPAPAPEPLKDTRDEVLKVILNTLTVRPAFIREKILIKLRCVGPDEEDWFKKNHMLAFSKWLRKCKNETWTVDNTGRWTIFPFGDSGGEARVEILTRKLDEDVFEDYSVTSQKNIMVRVTMY